MQIDSKENKCEVCKRGLITIADCQECNDLKKWKTLTPFEKMRLKKFANEDYTDQEEADIFRWMMERDLSVTMIPSEELSI